MKFVAVNIAQRDVALDYPEMPYFCYVHEPEYFPRDRSQARIELLVKWWNRAHELALEYYPRATHFLDIGSYFLDQTYSLRRLVRRYESLDCPEIILSGNVWLREYGVVPSHRTYDTWGYPDLENLRFHFFPPKGLVQVSAVGVPFIYPVQYYREHPWRIDPDWASNVSRPLWYANFCLDTKAPVFADFGVRFFRDYSDTDVPRRGSMHRLGRLIDRKSRGLLTRLRKRSTQS